MRRFIPLLMLGLFLTPLDAKGGAAPEFTLVAPSEAQISYDPTTGEGSGEIGLVIVENPNNPNFPNDTQGFSYGLSHSAELFIDDVGVPPASDRGIRPGPVLQAFAGGNGPAFFAPNSNPANGPGHTLAVIYEFFGGILLQFPSGIEVATILYQADPALMMGNEQGADVPLVWSSELGDPSVDSIVTVFPDTKAQMNFSHGLIQLVPGPATTVRFIRGDCSANDGVLALQDALFLLQFIFQSGDEPLCKDACDSDSDEALELGDALDILNFIFLNGKSPAPPNGTCGFDTGTPAGILSCEAYPPCA